MSEVIRIFVEKKDGFNVLAKQTLWDIRHNLGMKSVEDLRYIVRYDMTRRKPLFCQSLTPM